MFSTILVGVDDRRGGHDALVLAHNLSELGGGELVAVHVYPYEPFGMVAIRPAIDTTAPDEAEALVRAQLAETGIDARVEARADTSPGRGLHRAAEAAGADVVVVGCSHRGAVGRLVAADNTRAVLEGAGVPVVVARPAGAAPRAARVIGVGYDGSPESDAALAWAAQLAQRAGGTVRIVSVAEPPQGFSPSISYGINWVAMKPEREEHAKRLVADAVAQLREGAVGEATVGMARDELERLSHEVDMLVLGSRGYGPVRRTLLGSTSDWLVHHAACPVVVIPRAAARRTQTAEPTAAVKTTT
jgi:nucleotide-binding universal stress UspA family protein